MGERMAAARTAGHSAAIDRIREQGQALVAERKAISEMSALLEGCEWGSGNSVIKGANFSAATRVAFAKFCVVTRANPQIHVDILGGKPYLNAQYWTDLLNSNEHFIGYDQVNISASVSALYRKQAQDALTEAKQFEAADAALAGQLRGEAADLLRQAREVDRRRAEFGAPENVTHVYETIVKRYAQRAPLERIVAGDIEGSDFIQEIHECNWAGGKQSDPVGNANPGHTARTRSLRRAAVKAFSAWMENFDREISRAEEIMEAEWEEVRSERHAARAALPSSTGPQAVRTGGEPGAANPATAAPLPVEDLTEAPAAAPAPQPQPAPAFDVSDARKRFFATLRDAGIQGDARKAWAVENGLPESTQEWTQAQWERAIELLVAPTRAKYLEGCSVLGADPVAFAVEAIGHGADTLRDYLQCLAAINARVDSDEQGDLL